ncbi:UNVERIFIED_CONTAM: plasmid stabilization system protein ParE [Acetivibrio alkalicellulosi]
MRAYKINYLPVAKEDITDIIIYISEHLSAPRAAMDLMESLDESISLLQDFPYAYKLFRGIRPLEEEYRLLPVKNHAVFYVVREHEKIVEIHRVIYSMMDLNKIIG